MVSGDHHGVYSALQGNKQNKENAAICRARLHSNDVGAKSMDKRTRGQWDKEKGKHCTRCTGLFIRNKHRVDINGQERGGVGLKPRAFMYRSRHFLYFLTSLSGTQWNPLPLFCIAEQQLLALALFSVLTGGAEPEVVFCTSYFSVRNAQISYSQIFLH